MLHDILPLWDRAVVCIIKNNLITSEQLINIWSNLYNSNKEHISNALNVIKEIDPDFKEEILGYKLFIIEKAKNFITNINTKYNPQQKNTNEIEEQQKTNANNNTDQSKQTVLQSNQVSNNQQNIEQVNQNQQSNNNKLPTTQHNTQNM